MDENLGVALKGLRQEAGLTQEGLAERAGISARTVSDLERGLRTAVHFDTANRLASGWGLDEERRRRFESLARGRALSLSVPPAGALPQAPTPFRGRTRELESIKATLLGGLVRLLTLTGPGGIGKTRLALEAAREIQESYPDGCFFVSLGELNDASLVAPELAKTIGVVETGPGLEQLLIKYLGGRRVLIVLDTLEHLTAAAPLVYSVLLSCPDTTFLVPSRRRLRLRGEHDFPVPPLESPSEIGDDPSPEVMRWPATTLFWERALAVVPDLQLDRQSALLVVEVCRRLDGLPLAIELAAARVKHLPLAAIREQLDNRLELLVGGPVDLPLRQRAIRDTVAWSHDLLEGRAQTLFRRLSVFAGGWGLDDAAKVCGPVTEIADPLEGMSALVDQSLVVLDRNNQEPRYTMLDAVEEGRRWSDAALAMPGTAKPSLRAKAVWAASALAFPQGDHIRMDALASEGLALAGQSEDPMDRRNLLTIKGMVAMLQGRYRDALDPFRKSVAICRQLGLSWQLGTSYLNLGTALLHAGAADDALATLRDGLLVYRELGDEVFAAHINNTMAHVAMARNDIAGADRLGREALSAAAEQGERQGIADGLQTLAAVAGASSDPDRAATLAGAAEAIRNTIAARPGPFDVAIPGLFLQSAERTVTKKRMEL